MFLIFLSAMPLAAQEYIAKVEHYGIEEGLSHRQVNAIFQDSRGFIWIGTPNGLNRFDGYSFRQYTKEKDGLRFNYVQEIAEDADGWLWLVEEKQKSICLFHPDRGEVMSLEEKFGRTDSQFVRQKFLYKILNDDEGAIWLSAAAGNLLYRYHPASGVQAVPVQGSPGKIYPVRFSGHKTLWVTTENNVILELSATGKMLHRFENVWLYGNWALTDDGILTTRQNPAGKEYFTLFNTDGRVLPYQPLGEKAPYPALIFPFDSLGTFVVHDRLMDARGGVLAQWDFSQHDRNNFLWRTYFRDRAGRHWLGDDFGFYVLQIKKNRFQHYFFLKGARPGLGNSVRGILVTRDKLYANLEKYGLFEQDLRNGKSRQVEVAGTSWGNYALAATRSGVILSGNEKSFYRLSPDAKTGERFPVRFDAWAFCEDAAGKIWIGTASSGLFTLAPGAANPEPFTQYNGFDMLASAFILHIEQDDSGMLWVCASNGFYKVDPRKGVLARYWNGGKGAYFLPAENFLHFHLDADGVFWFATANGLVRAASRTEADGSRSPVWDERTGKLFNRANSLSNDFIYAVYEDNRHKLWMPTDHGITCMDKKTETVRTYFVSDGITDAEFNRKAHFQTPDGTLYFGGLNGINAFNPADFNEAGNAQPEMPLVITAFQQLDASSNRLVDHTAELLGSGTIVLRPDDRFFNLELALLSYDDSHLIQYAWKIEGLDKDWHYQKERHLNFGGLPYGTFALRIKAKAANGQWSNRELNLTVRVLRPWYLQAWFLVLAALLLGAGMRVYVRWRNRQHIREQRKLESLVAKATERIEQDKRTIEIQAEELRHLDQVKSNFFANVSHELRTPLTLMLGPVSSILKSGELGNRNFTYAQLIRQNCQQLLKLVGEILDLQKLESGKLELHPAPAVLYPLLKRIAAQFESLAQNKSVAFVFLYRAEKQLQIEVDAGKLELVLNNLLSNAMKFTGAGGRVELKAEDLGHSIRLTVTDTGRGIHPGDLPHIFDRFFQSRQPDAPTQGGTGIGLALVRELSVLFGGSVGAQSPAADGRGSAFTFEFPKAEVMGAVAQPAAEPPDSAYAAPATAPSGTDSIDGDPGNASILLVEDNRDLQTYVRTLLSEKYAVVTAQNGQEALELLSNVAFRLPDLIISDIMMPVMDGFQLLEKLKSDGRFRPVPVIMLTARADMQDKLRALRIGVDDYLLKPFEEEELLVRVAASLERYGERNRERATSSAATEPEFRRTEQDGVWLETLETLVAAEAQNDRLSVTWIADRLHLSERQFQRRLKLLTGLLPNAYIKEVRLQEARRLLELGRVQTVKEAAWAVSFRDEKYFSQLFRERFGKYPSEMMR